MYEKIIIPYKNMTIVKRLSDGAFIPMEPLNVDYQQYLEWLANNPENSNQIQQDDINKI